VEVQDRADPDRARHCQQQGLAQEAPTRSRVRMHDQRATLEFGQGSEHDDD